MLDVQGRRSRRTDNCAAGAGRLDQQKGPAKSKRYMKNDGQKESDMAEDRSADVFRARSYAVWSTWKPLTWFS